MCAKSNPFHGISSPPCQEKMPGAQRLSNRSAISNCRSLRRAMAAMFTNRLTCLPFERAPSPALC